MPTDHTQLRQRLASPAAALVAGLLVSATLLLLPTRCTAPAKGLVQTLLQPGRRAAGAAGAETGRVATLVGSHFHTASRLADAQDELRRLRAENRRLTGELAAATSRPAAGPAREDDEVQRLLGVRCISARLLGHQARAFLRRQELLDVGSEAGVEPDALVAAPPMALIDRGRDADVKAGRLVLSRGRVWGKIVEVGRYTSVVRRVTEPGYRDLVRLGTRDGPARPEGILEGTGEPLARVRLVDVTEPVAVEDPVWTAAGEGLLPEPLLCGRVVRLERPRGAAHWEIWMRPAVSAGDVSAGDVDELTVLQAELNPLRLRAGK